MDRDTRSPTAHKSKNQAKASARSYGATDKAHKYRAALGRIATKKGSSRSQDNGHVKPVSEGGSPSGKTVKQSIASNRGHGKGKSGSAPTKVRTRVTGKG